MPSSTTAIRPSTYADLPLIKEWLELEARDGVGFIHNWDLIESATADGEMTVFGDLQSPVAFLTYGLSRGSILQVRSDQKGRGIGRKLVEYAIAKADAIGNAVLVIQCEPKTSIPFWRRMGFVAHRDQDRHGIRDNIYMHRLSTVEHLDVRGDDLQRVTINVYPEWMLYRNGDIVAPDRVYYAMARLEGDRTLHLDHRVSIVAESLLRDPVIEIELWGCTWFRDKAKRDEARDLGFLPTPNCYGWYADTLELPGTPLPQ
ncbi:GNAT family N-acetyltransferase [Luteimonas sp. Y-2-2-4F]|nr:GNAT family N-acetyltransferase [Luteimonas sp. Y-2-2-4F]MCD9030187.1 GNAT family N-acetyltransferase [Luteimonas sp. Y-2-2-4F]